MVLQADDTLNRVNIEPVLEIGCHSGLNDMLYKYGGIFVEYTITFF